MGDNSNNEMKNLYEKKIVILEDENKNLTRQIKEKSNVKVFRKDSDFIEKKEKYEERISELEHTVFELQYKINEKEYENGNHVNKNEDLKINHAKTKEELFQKQSEHK